MMALRTYFKSLLMLLCFFSLLAGCGHNTPSPAPAPPTVGTLVLETKVIELTTQLPGRTTAFLTSSVQPQVSGIIKRRNFEEGGDVQEGQSLYDIDPLTYQATYDSDMATLAHDRAALLTAKAKINRYRPLAAAHAVSMQDLDDAKASYEEALADVQTAQANVEQARINLAYTHVMAPISGRIGHSNVTPGALVSSAQTTALATVTQLDPIYVDVIQPVATLLRLQREMAAGKMQSAGPDQARVTLKMEDGSDYAQAGILKFSEVTVDAGTGTVLLRSQFPNPDHLLLPGMYVHAELVEGSNPEALLVPQQAVSRNTHGDATVMMVGKDNIPEAHIFQTDRMIGPEWLVAGGLNAGDQIIVDGFQDIHPGMAVKTVILPLVKSSQLSSTK
jgi:membrane fusion protein (multidrug efflux system)